MTASTRAAAVWLLLTGGASAAAPFDGRWAADANDCASNWLMASPVTITSLTVSWPGTICTITRSYLVRDAWGVGARCSGEGITTNVSINLQVRNGRLSLSWGGAPPEELRRCP